MIIDANTSKVISSYSCETTDELSDCVASSGCAGCGLCCVLCAQERMDNKQEEEGEAGGRRRTD